MTKTYKKLTVICAGLMTLSGAAIAAEPQFYLEANVGQANISNVETKPYAGSINGVTWDARANIEYNSPVYWGLEIGANKLGNLPLRVGFAYTSMKAKFERGSISGSVVDNGSVIVDGTLPVTRADLAGLGLNFDNRINIYGVNAYYDFDTKSALKPYVGFGLGLADIDNAKDNEFVYSLHAGVNYDISKSTYIGARVGWYQISGPTDKLGIAYENVKATTFGATIGYRY